MTTYTDDLAFLRRHVEVLELGDGDGPRVAVVPAWQGRIVTSRVGGGDDASFGWLNRGLVESGEVAPKINAFGGEDRFWLGPEGGQFSIFTPPGGRFDLDDWRTPAGIDTERYAVDERRADLVRCAHEARFQNWSGTTFDVGIRRDLRLLSRDALAARLGSDLAGVGAVGFESVNTIENRGAAPWRKASGLLSVWSIGMFRHGPRVTVVVPFRPGSEAELGPVVNDAYFGPVPADRLVVGDGVLFFKGDGRHRSKIGVGPRRARDRLGSWDPDRGVLTLVWFDLPDGAEDYVNSMWEHQDHPYAGDVINSYNDGAWGADGVPLGPFYELETSSPAAALAPGESSTHTHRTVHLCGPRPHLDAAARAALGVGLDAVEAALP